MDLPQPDSDAISIKVPAGMPRPLEITASRIILPEGVKDSSRHVRSIISEYNFEKSVFLFSLSAVALAILNTPNKFN